MLFMVDCQYNCYRLREFLSGWPLCKLLVDTENKSDESFAQFDVDRCSIDVSDPPPPLAEVQAVHQYRILS